MSIRSSQNKGYSRLVAEWPQNTAYTMSKEGDRILVRFAKDGKADVSGLEKAAKNIEKVDMTSGKGEPLQLAVTIPKGSKFREFSAGTKFIIDVYDPDPSFKKEDTKKADVPAKADIPKTVATETSKAASAKPAEETLPQVVTEEKTDTIAHEDTKLAKPVPEAAVKPPVVEKSLDPYVVTLTSTTPFGLAVYRRGNALWVVTDAASLTDIETKTDASGQNGKPPEIVSYGTAKGYKVPLPGNAEVAVDGGGMAWKMVVNGGMNAPGGAKVVAPERKDGSNGEIFWPIKNVRKSINFTDPVTGEKMLAAIAPDAALAAGPLRRYVDFDSMTSPAGLVLALKTDDLKADVTTAGISVARPGGLRLSPVKDISARILKDGIGDSTPVGNGEAPFLSEQPKTEDVQSEAVKSEDLNAKMLPSPPADNTKTSGGAVSVDAEKEGTSQAETHAALVKTANEKPTGNNIYNFARWEMGGLSALEANQHAMMVELSQKEGDARASDVITLAKMLLASNRGAEVLGLLRIVEQQTPALTENREFIAIRGAANALSGKYDEAFEDLSRENLSEFNDVKYWQAFALAGVEDWKQAGTVLPADLAPINAYPKPVRIPLLLSFAEILLRSAKTDMAENILQSIKPDIPGLALSYVSSWNYLQGEAARQSGDLKRAEELWTPLVKNGKDDLFRAKAGLSLTKLELDEKKIKPAEAINRLEGLRYAWRGDELEALINFRLGQMYIDNKDYLKGLTVLRNASGLMPGTPIGQDIDVYTAENFKGVFNDDVMKNLSPLDAIRIHEEFKDMIPKGADGDAYTEKLAERLVDADLLGRAAALLEYLVSNRLQGDKKAEVAIRLAAIRLLDGNPDGALRSLDVAQDALNKITAPASAAATPAENVLPQNVQPQAGEPASSLAAVPKTTAETKKAEPVKADPEKQRQIYLLKARALSMKKMPIEAMAVLENMEPDADVNRLRADIAWTSGNWAEASDAFNDLIVAEDISPRRPLGEYQRDIVFNRAIALNLSNDRVALANLRDRYNGQMKETTKGAMFEIVTRPRRADMVGSREAIDSMISEIDLFQGFLDGYAKMDAPAAKPVTTPESPPAATVKAGEAAVSTPEKAVAAQTQIDKAQEAAPKDGVPKDKAPDVIAPSEKIPGDQGAPVKTPEKE